MVPGRQKCPVLGGPDKRGWVYREFKSYIFSVLYFIIIVSSKKYHYCAIFVQSLSAYATTDRSKKHLVKDDLY